MTAATDIDDAVLAGWPLPMPAVDDDKEDRGRVLLVAGSTELPGAPLLAGVAALRAGCGKVLVATDASIALPLGLAMPEARVLALPQDARGGLAVDGVPAIAAWSTRSASVLIGPGLVGPSCTAFVRALLPHLAGLPVVLDASAMEAVASLPPIDALVTPHAGEMAHLTGKDRAAVEGDPASAASQAAARWNAIVALKGAVTFIATPQGRLWRHDGRGLVGLATSGSGDVLAGLVAGLAARGAALEQAAVWAVALHARAGAALARRRGTLGYLARELADEVPSLL
jgi:ADP-dependent NAD(P)H-hydrate dehydratase